MSMRFDTSELRRRAPELRAGEEILLSGTVYTARDAAHKRMAALLAENRPLPFALEGAAIYYAGPTPARAGAVCGSFGPTTSGRMDAFAPALYDRGLSATIGKGQPQRRGRSRPIPGATAPCTSSPSAARAPSRRGISRRWRKSRFPSWAVSRSNGSFSPISRSLSASTAREATFTNAERTEPYICLIRSE